MTEAKTYIAPSLLQPDNHAVLLIDYQYLQLVTACSHNPQGVIAAATLLARGAKLFNVPTFLTTGLAERQGLVREVAAVFRTKHRSTAPLSTLSKTHASSSGLRRQAKRSW
jgi:hypothetical protein